jgi:hypothetical protein
MKRLALVFLLAGSSVFPQNPGMPATQTEKFGFKARFNWYAERTYLDPWSHANLIGGIAGGRFCFRRLKTMGQRPIGPW